VSYSGVTSFARCKYTKDLTGVDVAITGIPFDVSVTRHNGSRFGLRQVRELSSMLAWDAPYGWPINPLEEFNIIDYGDCAFDHGKLHEAPAAIEEHISTILNAGATAISIGGDHYTTLPNLRAHAAKHGPVAIIQFDAHSDTWVDDDPDRMDHGTFMYRAIQEGLIVPEKSVQVGIRTTNEDTKGFNTLDARFVHEHGPMETAKRIKEIVGDHKVYLTFVSMVWTQHLHRVQVHLFLAGSHLARWRTFYAILQALILLAAMWLKYHQPMTQPVLQP
jgi:agmatinase